jgi:hypothetical protein
MKPERKNKFLWICQILKKIAIKKIKIKYGIKKNKRVKLQKINQF